MNAIAIAEFGHYLQPATKASAEWSGRKCAHSVALNHKGVVPACGQFGACLSGVLVCCASIDICLKLLKHVIIVSHLSIQILTKRQELDNIVRKFVQFMHKTKLLICCFKILLHTVPSISGVKLYY